MDIEFIYYCIAGNLGEAKKLYSLGSVDIHAYNDDAFRRSCYNGHINVAQWLYSLGDVNIHAVNEAAFVWSCTNGYMNVAQWLYSLGGIDIHASNDFAFRWSCIKGHMNIVQWLLSIDKFDNKIVDECLPEKLYEYAFKLNYLPIDKMKPAYEKYKVKIKEQIKEKRNDGPISLFEINELVELIVSYV